MEQLDENNSGQLNNDGWGSPDILVPEQEFKAAVGRIRRRCQMLHYADMVAPLHGHMYEIANNGLLYLREEIDARYQPCPMVQLVLRG